MKAIINLAVEVDLSQIICDDSLEALKLYTGEATKEGIGTFYMDKLARTITSAKEFTMPHVKYQLTGNIVPTENLEDLEQYSMADLVTDVENEGSLEPVEEVVELDETNSETQADFRVEFVERVVQFMEKVSMDKGLPKEIGITAEIFDNVCVLENGEVMSRIAGLPVVRKDIESVLEITYEPYGSTGELESAYLPTLGSII